VFENIASSQSPRSSRPHSGTRASSHQPVGPFVVTSDGVVLFAPPGLELPPGTVSWQDWLDKELSEGQDR
jgi:hypothetical protein